MWGGGRGKMWDKMSGKESEEEGGEGREVGVVRCDLEEGRVGRFVEDSESGEWERTYAFAGCCCYSYFIFSS